MNNDQAGSAIFLGLILFGFFLWMLSKIATKVFIELGHLFNAIGNAATSFFGMLWVLVQFAGILGLGILLVYAVYKFVLLVKNGTEIMKQAERRLNEFHEQVSAENKSFQSRVSSKVWELHKRLEEALKEPEVAPPEVSEEAADAAEHPASPQPQMPAQATTEQQPTDTNESTVSVINRY